jgi:hypothetical protein
MKTFTLKSDVVRICRESGLQLTLLRPAEPSSILQCQSGFSKENTFTKDTLESRKYSLFLI